MPFSILHLSRRWLIFAAVVLVYFPSLRNGFIWDDDQYVVNNATLRDVPGLVDIWLHPSATPQYYPLVHSSFWLEYHLLGLNPIGYHLDNILLHALSCVLLLGVLRRLRIRGAGWVVALFAMHPVTVESVAWVTERKNVLSAVFTLAAMGWAITAWSLEDDDSPRLAGEPARRFSGDTAERRRAGSPAKRGAYALCAAFFFAALLSKTVACTFPIIVLLLIYWRRGRVRFVELMSLLPLLALGGGLGLLTAYLEKHHVGASGTEWSLTITQRCVLAGRIVWFYVGKLLWPWPIIFVYPRWTLRPSEPWQWIATSAVVVAFLTLWFARRRIGRGPVALAAMFVVTLLPALGFINVFPFRYSFVADHFQYLAAVVVFVAVGWCASNLRPRFAELRLVILLILAALTVRRQWAYRDLQTLWTDTALQNPSAWIAWNNLAMLEFGQGEPEIAVNHFRQAAADNPDAPGLQANLGAALVSLNRMDEAVSALNLATIQDPTDAFAWHDLGSARAALHQDSAAQSAYAAAVALRPHDSQMLADDALLKATSNMPSVRDPNGALAMAKQAEVESNGYSITAVEARAAAEAAMDRFNDAAADANRAATMADAAGDPNRAAQLRQRATQYNKKGLYRRARSAIGICFLNP